MRTQKSFDSETWMSNKRFRKSVWIVTSGTTTGKLYDELLNRLVTPKVQTIYFPAVARKITSSRISRDAVSYGKIILRIWTLLIPNEWGNQLLYKGGLPEILKRH